jgi:lipoprotein signal peptidase
VAAATGGYRGGVERFPTLELAWYPRRVLLMALASLVVLVVDLASKAAVVALEPSALLFNVSQRSPFGLGDDLIVVLVGISLAACVLPTRAVALGAGLALGGALGNVTSRHWWASRGGSPDFIPFADGSSGNLADIVIVVGGLLAVGAAVTWTLLRARGG